MTTPFRRRQPHLANGIAVDAIPQDRAPKDSGEHRERLANRRRADAGANQVGFQRVDDCGRHVPQRVAAHAPAQMLVHNRP